MVETGKRRNHVYTTTLCMTTDKKESTEILDGGRVAASDGTFETH